MADDPKPYRKWFKVGIVFSIAWSLISLLSWFMGPSQDENAIALRLFLTALGFAGTVACIIGLVITNF